MTAKDISFFLKKPVASYIRHHKQNLTVNQSVVNLPPKPSRQSDETLLNDSTSRKTRNFSKMRTFLTFRSARKRPKTENNPQKSIAFLPRLCTGTTNSSGSTRNKRRMRQWCLHTALRSFYPATTMGHGNILPCKSSARSLSIRSTPALHFEVIYCFWCARSWIIIPPPYVVLQDLMTPTDPAILIQYSGKLESY